MTARAAASWSSAGGPDRAGAAGPAVEFTDVSFTYPGSAAPALDRVSLRVADGQRLGILGPNGGGKSTLLKIALGMLEPATGTVRVMGLAPREARARGLIGYVPQKVDAELGFPLSVRQVVMLGRSWREAWWRRPSAACREKVAQLLALVGIEDLAERPIGHLSGGQLQRVMIARALAAGGPAGAEGAPTPRLLALDEPTVGIDAAGQGLFADLLARLHTQLGLTILIVSHDLRAIVAGCDQVACLAGRLHYHASPQGLTPQVLADVFSHDVAGFSGSMHVHVHDSASCCGHEPAADVAILPAPMLPVQGQPHPHAPAPRRGATGGEAGNRP